MLTVAALFVDPKGVYAGLKGVEAPGDFGCPMHEEKG